jgi:beta-galactosidase GanA
MIITYSIYWGNPYTKPPNNLPEEIVRYPIANPVSRSLDCQPFANKINAIIDRLYKRGLYGYVIGFDYSEPNKSTRKWSKEAKVRNRQNRLRKRLEKKYSIPELLNQEYENKINQNPKYYLEGEFC